MKRKAVNQLIAWKENGCNEPMLITGMRTVGKTYLAYDFAKSFFSDVLYLNLEAEPLIVNDLKAVFQGNSSKIENNNSTNSLEDILNYLLKYFELPDSFLPDVAIIIDEVYVIKEILPALADYLSAGDLHIPFLFISSYDIENLNGYEKLILRPLEFDEFLEAIDKKWYIEVIQAHYQTKKNVPAIVHEELLSIFDEYITVGGMPAAVNEYINLSMPHNIYEKHRIIKQIIHSELQAKEDILSETNATKCNQIFASIENQFEKANCKFQFSLIRKGITYSMYSEAIDFLVKNNYVYRLNELNKENQFKLYFSEFSLFGKNVDISTSSLTFKKRLEHYVIDHFIASGADVAFWESASQAKLDLVITEQNKYIPVELKFDNASKGRSIHSFNEHYETDHVLCISGRDFEITKDNVLNIPVYSVFCIEK